MNKIIFTDRKPANNNKYIIKEGNNVTPVIIDPDFEITEEGTPLNAETLNAAFAEKQGRSHRRRGHNYRKRQNFGKLGFQSVCGKHKAPCRLQRGL